MELILQIFKQLPPFWPRLAALIVLVLLVALPQTRSLLKRHSARLDRAKRLLELRKLEIEVAKLRASVPEAGESALDAQIQSIIGKEVAEEDEPPPLAWLKRLELSVYGALGFVAFGVLSMGFSGRQAGMDLAAMTLKELLIILPCALIASAFPARARWGPVFYGFLIPVLVVALMVTARMQD